MRERDAVKIIRDFLSRQFPKSCNCCGKNYHTLADFLQYTTHTGKPVSYDAEEDNWYPTEPIGTISVYTCSCGSSMSLSSKGMNTSVLWELMDWAKKRANEQQTNISDVLDDLRNKIERGILHDKS